MKTLKMLTPSIENGIPADALAAIPPEAKSFLEEMGYLDGDRLSVGDAVTPFELETLDRSRRVQIGGASASKPVILVFGSYT